jgi:hypothetical protein
LASAADGPDGLIKLKEALATASISDSTSLDLAFGVKGIGKDLMSSAAESQSQHSKESPQDHFAGLKSGLKMVAERDWLQAHDIFSAKLEGNPDSTAESFLALCLFHLDSHDDARRIIAGNQTGNPIAHLVAGLLEDVSIAKASPSARRGLMSKVCSTPLSRHY